MSKQFFPISRGAIALTQGILEKNNCVVRALANCADLDYAYADRLCRDYGRKIRHGMHAKDFIPMFFEHGGAKKMEVFGNQRNALYLKSSSDTKDFVTDIHESRMTVNQMMKNSKYSVGVYAVLIYGHIFTLRNGAIYDLSPIGGKNQVFAVFHF